MKLRRMRDAIDDPMNVELENSRRAVRELRRMLKSAADNLELPAMQQEGGLVVRLRAVLGETTPRRLKGR